MRIDEARRLFAYTEWANARIVNVLDIVGASMGLSQADQFKRLKMMQDADAIVADCADLIALHGLDPADARRAVEVAMLAEQFLPLKGRPAGPASTRA